MTTGDVNAVLAAVEVSAQDSPEALRARADQVMADWHQAVDAIMRLGIEAATLRGRAAAIEARDAARQPVVDAAAAVDAALDAYSASGDDEAEASRHATTARHDFERARDEHEQAKANGAEPAVETELGIRAMAAAMTDERRAGVYAEARAARGERKRELDTARVQLAQAREALQRAEDAIDHPLQAPGRTVAERFAALLHTWPLRAALRNTPGFELDGIDLELVKEMCRAVASDLGVVPPHLAQQIRNDTARDVADQLRRQYQSTEIALPGGQVTSLGRLGGAIRGPGQG